MNSDVIDLINGCRICTEEIETGVLIEEIIRTQFFEITGIELIDEPENYSNIICENCYIKLNSFSQYRQELIDSQKNLYGSKEEHLEVIYEEVEATDNSKVCIIEESGDKNERNEIFEVSFYDSSDSAKGSKTCHICGQKFAASGYYHHMKRAHSVGKELECDTCGKTFKLKSDLMVHLKKHLDRESRVKYTCNFCESDLLSKAALSNHIQIYHSDILEEHPCDIENCDKIFKSRLRMLQHKRTAHENGKHMCLICEKHYSCKQYLRKHIKQCHSAKVLANCPICNKVFPEGVQLRRHMANHEEQQYTCEYENCNKVFQFKTSLQKHIQTVHVNLPSVSCIQCGFTFPTIRHLNRHTARQHSLLKVQCEVEGCSQLFGRKDYLLAHYKGHKDIDEIDRQRLIEGVKFVKAISW